MAIESIERMVKDQEVHQRLKGFDYVEFYVGNAHQAAYYYRTAFGFKPVAYAGLETGERDHTSIVLVQGDIRLVLTSPLSPSSPVADHLKKHGDSVKDIALAVADASEVFESALRHGAKPLMEPTVSQDDGGTVIKAIIATCGDTVHSLVQRNGYSGRFLPGYQSAMKSLEGPPIGLSGVDHIAINIEAGGLDQWTDFYNQTLGFHLSKSHDISTEYSAMNIRVVESPDSAIKFTLVEPADGKRRSQIEEFLLFNVGPGVQHIAFAAVDILETVQRLMSKTIEFVPTPDAYYDMLKERVGDFDEDLQALHALGILVDRDRHGYLMQCFTRPLQNRPTLFLEVIQRKGALGFGEGNIKALFEAVEREQAMRGNF